MSRRLKQAAMDSHPHRERWAWWALLVGNTVALVSAMMDDKTVNGSTLGKQSARMTPRHSDAR